MLLSKELSNAIIKRVI